MDNKFFSLLLLPLLVIPSVAYGATVFPQLEKLVIVDDFVEQDDLRLLNNNFELETNGAQKDWESTIYKLIGGSFGLLLPHPSDPDNRDVSTYIQAASGSCDNEIANNFTSVGAICEHVMAVAQIEIAGMHFEDMFRVAHYSGVNTYVKSPDLFHERSQACSDIQSQVDLMWGANFDFETEEHQYDKMLRDGFIGKRVQSIEDNLSPSYKLLLKDHIETNTFVDFYTSEVKVTHPAGVNNCDLG